MSPLDKATMNMRGATRLNPWLIRASIAATVIYLFWRIFFTLPINNGIVAMILAITLLLSEISGTLVSNIQYFESLDSVEPKVPVIPIDWYPDIDIFVTTHSESVDLLLKTLNGCVHMEYPDKSKVHIWLCDDGNRQEMAELADSLGVGYLGFSGNKEMKAGNLNHAMSLTSAPLVVTFDSDMIPTRKFLMKSVPIFFLPKLKFVDDVWLEREPDEIDEDYKIGFVQTPQSFYNADLFQFNLFSENRIPNEQDYFYRNIQVNRNKNNSAIYGGSNTVISRAALEEVGGIATGTVTEDYATGIRIQRKGWRTFATSDPLAHGLSVDNFKGLISQRVRWGRGVVYSTMKEGPMTAKEFTTGAKLGYFCCFMYWHTFLARFIYIAAPILSVLFQLHIVECSLWQVVAIWLPSYVLNFIVLNKSSSQMRNAHLSNTVDTIMSPYMMLPITAEQLGIRLKTFKVTEKGNIAHDNTLVFALPHAILLIASVLALVRVITPILHGNYGTIILTFWILVNGKNLILSIMFMQGRTNYRSTERFYVSLPVEIDLGRKVVQGHTIDISEEGMAVELDTPEYLSPDKEFKVTVTYSVYKAEITANVVHVEKRKNTWKYCLIFSDIDEQNRLQYLQIVYDRHHSMPDKIIDNWSIFDDFSINIKKRAEPLQAAQRKLPRIMAAIPLTIGEEKGAITSFNYRYISVKLPNGIDADDIQTIQIDDFSVDIVKSQILPHNNEVLYEIMNYEDLFDNFRVDGFVNTLLEDEGAKLSAATTLSKGINDASCA